MSRNPHVLIVDDDLEIRKLLGRYLTEQDFRVTLASDRRTMDDALGVNEINLVVLDVMLPDGSGLDICRDLRRQGSHIPVILLTALKEDIDRIIGLEIGADDYVGKPFNPRSCWREYAPCSVDRSTRTSSCPMRSSIALEGSS